MTPLRGTAFVFYIVLKGHGTYIDLLVPIVMQSECTIELGVGCHSDIIGVTNPLRNGHASVLLHLNVVEFSTRDSRKERRRFSFLRITGA